MEFQAIVANVIVMGALGQRGSMVETLYSLSLRVYMHFRRYKITSECIEKCKIEIKYSITSH